LSCDFSSQKVLIIKTLCKFAAKSVSLSKRYTFFSFLSQNLIHHIINRLNTNQHLLSFQKASIKSCKGIINKELRIV